MCCGIKGLNNYSNEISKMVKGTIPFKYSECGKRFMALFFAECKV